MDSIAVSELHVQGFVVFSRTVDLHVQGFVVFSRTVDLHVQGFVVFSRTVDLHVKHHSDTCMCCFSNPFYAIF